MYIYHSMACQYDTSPRSQKHERGFLNLTKLNIVLLIEDAQYM